MNHLIYSRLEQRTYGKANTKFTFHSGDVLHCSTLNDEVHEMQVGCYYWVSFDSVSKEIHSQTEITLSDKKRIQASIKNLTRSSDKAFAAIDKLSKSERAEFCHTCGFALSGTFAVINGIQSVNALFAWEPVNLLMGLGLAAGSSLLAASQYEQLTEAQKRTAEYLKEFKQEFLVYQAAVQRYKPEQYADAVLADVRYTTVISRIRHSLPEIDLSKFTVPNFRFA